MNDKTELEIPENKIQIPNKLWSMLNQNFKQAVINKYHDSRYATITLWGEADLFISNDYHFGEMWDYDSDKFDPCNLTFYASDFNIDLSNISDWRKSITKRPEGL